MANRRISELQEIAGIDLAEADLFTVVKVAEADPAIKNKRLTVSGTKAYLDIFYLPRTGGTVSGSVTIQENLTVSGLSTLSSGLNVTQTGNIDTFFVSGDATISGTTSGTTFTVQPSMRRISTQLTSQPLVLKQHPSQVSQVPLQAVSLV